MRSYFSFVQGEKRKRCLASVRPARPKSFGLAFQRSTKEKEQVEECTFIIEPLLRDDAKINFHFDLLFFPLATHPQAVH